MLDSTNVTITADNNRLTVINASTDNEFEQQVRALPTNWYKRVNMWSPFDDARLREAIELVLSFGVTSPEQLLLLLSDNSENAQVTADKASLNAVQKKSQTEEVAEDNDKKTRQQTAACLVAGHLRLKRAGELLVRILLNSPASSDCRPSLDVTLNNTNNHNLNSAAEVTSASSLPEKTTEDKKAVEKEVEKEEEFYFDTSHAIQTNPSLNPSELLRITACEALGLLKDKQNLEPLLTVFEDNHSSNLLGFTAACAIGQLGSREGLMPLLDSLLHSPKLTRRMAAARGICQLLDKRKLVDDDYDEIVEPILALLSSEKEPLKLRSSIISIFYYLKSKNRSVQARILDLLLNLLVSKDEILLEIRRSIPLAISSTVGLTAKGKIDPSLKERGTQVLFERLRDQEEDLQVRTTAATALSFADCPTIVPALLELLEEQRQNRIDNKSFGGPLTTDEEAILPPGDVKKVVVKGNVGESEAEIANEKNGNATAEEKVRQEVIRAIGWYNDACAVEPLSRILLDTEESVRVRAEAASSLGRVGDSKALPLLVATLKDEQEASEVRRAAATALGELKDAEALPILYEMVDELSAKDTRNDNSSNTISNRGGLNKYNLSDYYHKSSLANNSEKNSTTNTKEKVQEENNRKLQEAAERAIKSIEQGNT